MKKYTAVFSALVLLSLSIISCGPVYELKVNCGSGGSVQPSGGFFHENQLVQLQAVPKQGYYFTGWGNIGSYSRNAGSESTVNITMPPARLNISAGFAERGKGWTVMIYMAADNNLAQNAVYDLNEMEAGLHAALEGGNSSISSDLKVLVLADFAEQNDSVLYLISPDNSDAVVSAKVGGSGYPASEVNMGDPQTLKDFIKYGLKNYPSKNNALILWNHGGGAKSAFGSKSAAAAASRNICSDVSNGDILYNNELQSGIKDGLSGSGVSKFDLIGMDACLMGTVETAYELRGLGSYMAASPANEWGRGWDYDKLFRTFSKAGNPPAPAELAVSAVKSYYVSTKDVSKSHPNTMTAVDISADKMNRLKTAIDSFAAAIYGDGTQARKEAFQDVRDKAERFYKTGDSSAIRYSPYSDIYSFCREIKAEATFSGISSKADDVLSALSSAVIASASANPSTTEVKLGSYYYPEPDAAVRGLSIFLSHGETGNYKNFDGWYTSKVVDARTSSGARVKIGGIDFCSSDSDGNVEGWRELFEAWYDPATAAKPSGETPGRH